MKNMIPITLDVNGKTPQAETKVKQNDTGSHALDITVLDRSQPVDLTGCRAVFYTRKPSGAVIYNAAQITEASAGRITVDLTSQTLAEPGRLKFEITIYGPDDSILTTLTDESIIVEPVIREDGAVESTDEFTALTEAMTEVNAVISGAEEQTAAAEAAAARAEEQADAAETAASQASEIYNQVRSELEAGNLKGDKGDKGDTGIAGPLGPRGYPGGVAKMVTLPLPCMVPVGADAEAPAAVRISNFDETLPAYVVSLGPNMFNPQTASDWSTGNASKTVINSVTEDGAVNITCKGSGATVTTPVISLGITTQYTITRDVSKASICTGKFEIIACSGEGEEGNVIFSHNNTLTAQRSYLFTATYPYIKIRWTASSAVYGEMEIRYEINEGNPYGITNTTAGEDLAINLVPYQYADVQYDPAGVSIPAYPDGWISVIKGTLDAAENNVSALDTQDYTAEADIKTAEVTLLDTVLMQDIKLVEIDRFEGRAISGLSRVSFSAARPGQAEKTVVRVYDPPAQKIMAYAADIGVGGTMQVGDRIVIKGE